MDRLIVTYLYLFIPVSLLTGFMLRNNITVAGLTPSLFLTAAITFILGLFFLNNVLTKNKVHIYIILSTVVFLFVPLFYLVIHGFGYIYEEYNYTITILSTIFILTYISYYSEINLYMLDNIIHVANIFIIGNVLLSWILGIGFPSYIIGGVEVGNKGYLYGGNTASVLSLVTLIYYLFNYKSNTVYKWIFVGLSFLSAIVVKTIASVIAPLLIIVYFAVKTKYRYFYINVGITIFILSPYPQQVIDNYLTESYRYQRFVESNEDFEESRRLHDSFLQIQYQVENPITIIFGTGRSGQLKFWNRINLNFAGTDISDILMRYGLLGLLILLKIYLWPIILYFKYKYKYDNIFVGSLFILLYGLLGGYLFTSITSLVYLVLFISYINISLRYISEANTDKLKMSNNF
jgi:hypothetical protein